MQSCVVLLIRLYYFNNLRRVMYNTLQRSIVIMVWFCARRGPGNLRSQDRNCKQTLEDRYSLRGS